jgi:type IV pilus assembly protein PilB
VLAQRLVRLICTHCKRPVKVDAKLLEESALDPALVREPQFYEGAWVHRLWRHRFQGTHGDLRAAQLSDRIREMILNRRPTSEVKKVAHEEGMRFLRESAVEKVLHGLTTLREINKVTFVE